MNQEQTELARRLVAHPRWRWVAGMLAFGRGYDDLTYTDTTTPQGWEGSTRVNTIQSGQARDADGYRVNATEAVPDLTDYATAAILLRLCIDECESPEEVAGLLTPIKEGTQDMGTRAAEWLLMGKAS